MTLVFFIQAVVLGLIEGLTEFLPISSTGHLIIGAHLINANHPNIEVFEIFIQLGAILAIIYEYRVQLLNKTLHLSDKKSKTFFSNIFLAFLPAAIVGLAFHDVIKIFLFNPIVVSCALIIGGILILVIEKKTNIGSTITLNNIYYNKSNDLDSDYKYIDYGCSILSKKSFLNIKKNIFDLGFVFKKLCDKGMIDFYITKSNYSVGKLTLIL